MQAVKKGDKAKTVRIGCGQGFWGDWLDAPKRLVEAGDLDYLILDYLAEVTMSILAKQKAKNPQLGYGRDLPALLCTFGEKIVAGKLKVVTNAGGLNPLLCAEACVAQFREKFPQYPLPKIAIVTGDDLMGELPRHLDAGEKFVHLESQKPISTIVSNIKSMNAYIGVESVVEALNQGAQIVLTGRIADPAMCLAPLVSEFGWALDDWNRLACGIVAGHIIECGSQSTGGNYSFAWQQVPNPWDIGYPIVECAEDGSFIVTKPLGSGGLVTEQSVIEQLVYEIADPANYITPDVVVDFTTIKVKTLATDRVQVSGATGKEKPAKLKISGTYHSGFKAEGTLVLVGPQVLKKAAICKEMVAMRLAQKQLNFEELLFENLGNFSCIPGMEDKQLYPEPGELLFRVAVRDLDKAKVEQFTREIAPLVLSGPSGITGYAGGKGEVKEVVSFWPCLIDRNKVVTAWRFIS
jgi:hypothetical protein